MRKYWSLLLGMLLAVSIGLAACAEKKAPPPPPPPPPATGTMAPTDNAMAPTDNAAEAPKPMEEQKK